MRSIKISGDTAQLVRGVNTAFAGSHSSCPTQGGTLKYGVKAEPPSYDMHGTNSYAVMHFVAQHYSTLLTFDWEKLSKLEGDLQKVGQCQKTVSAIHLNYMKGVKFHDGTPLTSEDVKQVMKD